MDRMKNDQRIIWIQCLNEIDGSKLAHRLGQKLGSRGNGIRLNAMQWLLLARNGGMHALGKRHDVFYLTNFEFESVETCEELLASIETLMAFRDYYRFKIVLISSPFFRDEKRFRSRLKPIVILDEDEGGGSGSANDLVHDVLERASLVVGKAPLRLTEQAADYLEGVYLNLGPDQALQDAISAILRMPASQELNLECFNRTFAQRNLSLFLNN